jgi:tetratricopeptide (TPR) repeat protein
MNNRKNKQNRNQDEGRTAETVATETRKPTSTETQKDPVPAKPDSAGETSPARSSATFYIWSTLALLVGIGLIAGYFWYRTASTPERGLQAAIQIAKTETTDENRTQQVADLLIEVTKLEGDPRFELHRDTLRGIALVKQRMYGDVDNYFFHLADAPPEVRGVGLLHLGIARYHQQRFEEAARYLKQASASDPNDTQAQDWLKRIEFEMTPTQVMKRAVEIARYEDWDEYEALRLSLKDVPDAKAEYSFLTGMQAMREGNLRLALDSFQESGNSVELRESSLLGIANVYAAAGEMDQAREIFLQAVIENDECVEAHQWLSAFYYDQGAMDYAAVHLLKLMEIRPNDPRPVRLYAYASRDLREYERAIEYYEKALLRNPTPQLRREILVELADCLIMVRRYEDADKALTDPVFSPDLAGQQAMQRDVLLAKCMITKGESKEALSILDKILTMNPSGLEELFNEALLTKGEALLAENKPEEAVAAFKDAVKYVPGDFTAHFKLSQAYRLTGETELAEKAAEESNRLVEASRVMTELNRTAAQEQDNAEVRVQLGLKALEISKLDLAGFWFRTALRIDPFNKQAQAELKKLANPAPEPPKQIDQNPSTEPDKPSTDTDKPTTEAPIAPVQENTDSSGDANKPVQPAAETKERADDAPSPTGDSAAAETDEVSDAAPACR